MPVIQDKSSDFGDVLGGIMGTIGSYVAGKNEKKQRDEDAARQAQRDAQANAIAQGNLAVRQQDAATAAQRELDEAKHQAAEDLHTAHEDAVAQAKLDLQRTKDAHAFQLALKKIDDEFKLGMAKIHSAQSIEQVRSATAIHVAGIHASATVQAAAIRASSRGGGRGRGGGTASTSGLSAQGQKFLEMLTNTNNPATQKQAREALGSSGLSDADKGIIAGILGSKAKGTYVLPGGNTSAAPKPDFDRGLGGLPGGVQSLVIKMRKQGVSDTGINQMIQASNLPDDVKAASAKALSGGQ